MLSLDSYNHSQKSFTLQCSGADCRNMSCEHGLPSSSPVDPDSCPVCFEEDPDTVLLPCSHKFHSDCILQWVEHNFSCPMCRQEISQFFPLKGDINPRFEEIWNKHYLEGDTKEEEYLEEVENDGLKKSTETQALESEVILLEEPKEAVEEVAPLCLLETEDVEEAYFELEEEMDPEIGDEKIEPQPMKFDDQHGLGFDDHAMRMFLMKSALNMYTVRPMLTWKMLHNFIRPQKRKVRKVVEEIPYEPVTFDNLRSGACSGVFTTLMRMLVERKGIRHLYPIAREVTPNVAIYFTVYEEMKKIMGRQSDSSVDIFRQCFCSGFVGGFCAYLPAKSFSPLVPLQFGLHFGVFEVAKQKITEITGRKRLTVVDVGSTAVLGGALGSCITYPLRALYANVYPLTTASGVQVVLTKCGFSGLFAHCIKMSPLWATTAVGFDFSRRFITNT